MKKHPYLRLGVVLVQRGIPSHWNLRPQEAPHIIIQRPCSVASWRLGAPNEGITRLYPRGSIT